MKINWVIRIVGISLVLAIVIIVSSCNKYLGVQPTSIITESSFFQTSDEMNSALTGVYQILDHNRFLL